MKLKFIDFMSTVLTIISFAFLACASVGGFLHFLMAVGVLKR